MLSLNADNAKSRYHIEYTDNWSTIKWGKWPSGFFAAEEGRYARLLNPLIQRGLSNAKTWWLTFSKQVSRVLDSLMAVKLLAQSEKISREI